MTFTFGETVTITRRTASTPDSDGNDAFTTSTKTLANVPVWNPAFGDHETTQGADQVTSDLALWMPYGTAIGALDAVTVYGDSYEVVGRPAKFKSPFTGSDGLLVHVRRVTG